MMKAITYFLAACGNHALFHVSDKPYFVSIRLLFVQHTTIHVNLALANILSLIYLDHFMKIVTRKSQNRVTHECELSDSVQFEGFLCVVEFTIVDVFFKMHVDDQWDTKRKVITHDDSNETSKIGSQRVTICLAMSRAYTHAQHSLWHQINAFELHLIGWREKSEEDSLFDFFFFFVKNKPNLSQNIWPICS